MSTSAGTWTTVRSCPSATRDVSGACGHRAIPICCGSSAGASSAPTRSRFAPGRWPLGSPAASGRSRAPFWISMSSPASATSTSTNCSGTAASTRACPADTCGRIRSAFWRIARAACCAVPSPRAAPPFVTIVILPAALAVSRTSTISTAVRACPVDVAAGSFLPQRSRAEQPSTAHVARRSGLLCLLLDRLKDFVVVEVAVRKFQ